MSKSPASVPTSPETIVRRQPLLPITPQRINRINKQLTLRAVSSPLTPAKPSLQCSTSLDEATFCSPATPFSNTNSAKGGVDFSSPASVTTTESGDSPSTVSSGTKVESESSPSPDVMTRTKSLADVAANWRVRAKENGIKVGLTTSDDVAIADPSEHNNKDLIPLPFLSTHRRTRTKSRHSLIQIKTNELASFTPPKAARRVSLSGFGPGCNNENLNTLSPPNVLDRYPMSLSRADASVPSSKSMALVMEMDNSIASPSPRKITPDLNTPSPRTSSAIVQRLKQRGSLTDPAQPRRRAPFGSESGDFLFDITESGATDFETLNDALMNVNNHITKPEVANPNLITAKFGSPISLPTTMQRVSRARAFSEISNHDLDSVLGHESFLASPLARINGGTNHLFDDVKNRQWFEAQFSKLPTPPRLDAYRNNDTQAQRTPNSNSNPTSPSTEQTCSVCSAASTLSTLVPCGHLLCSSCLTGALNIVGEKDMCCAVCECLVKDFKIIIGAKGGDILNKASKGTEHGNANEGGPDTETKPEEPTRTPVANNSLPTFAAAVKQEPRVISLNSPIVSSFAQSDISFAALGEYSPNGNVGATELAVLRIDNVPWDITPPALHDFFHPYSLSGAHVLLEPKGKTLSHAYVELAIGTAKEALRSVQNKTMGKGRRMRGVTVTMCSQGELMRALFPSWKGTFDGCRPSLNGLENNNAKIAKALEGGLVSLHELDGLVTLMKNPDSHFLKVPTLPFYSLISILSKFPTDLDSRVFWSVTLRDMLYDMTLSALQILISRMGTEKHDQFLLELLAQVGVNCPAFTHPQKTKLVQVLDNSSVPAEAPRPPSALAAKIAEANSAKSQEALGGFFNRVKLNLNEADGLHNGNGNFHMGMNPPSAHPHLLNSHTNRMGSGVPVVPPPYPQSHSRGPAHGHGHGHSYSLNDALIHQQLALSNNGIGYGHVGANPYGLNGMGVGPGYRMGGLAPLGMNGLGPQNLGLGLHPQLPTHGHGPGPLASQAHMQSPYNLSHLAREFGVEPDLVHALAQRLSLGSHPHGVGVGGGM